MKRALVAAAYAGVLTLQVAVAVAYAGRGTWWHYLLHQLVGWGLGLAGAGALMAVRWGWFAPPVGAAVLGQLVSIAPDLAFKYLRMPHTRGMDLWVGHISLHRGPSPVLVALGSSCWAAARGSRPPTDASGRRWGSREAPPRCSPPRACSRSRCRPGSASSRGARPESDGARCDTATDV